MSSERDALFFPDRHSTKIYQVFGFAPGHTPPLSRIFDPRQQQQQMSNGQAAGPSRVAPSRVVPDNRMRPKSTQTFAECTRWDLGAFGPVWYFFSLSPFYLYVDMR